MFKKLFKKLFTPKGKFCNECRYLCPTEKEQDISFKERKTHGVHMCKYFNKPVYHGSYHPKIMKRSECEFENNVKS
jgi:hypothetical protein